MSGQTRSGLKAPYWLDRYATGFHKWKQAKRNGVELYYRPLGLCESFFDTDGTDFGGRADSNALLQLECRISLGKDAFRRRICLAWAVLRTQHVLLSARTVSGLAEIVPGDVGLLSERYFVVEELRDPGKALHTASETLVFVEDYYPQIDVLDLNHHIMNCARLVDPAQAMGKLFLLPLEPLPDGRSQLQAIMVVAHAIADGTTNFRWNSHLIDLLNLDTSQLEHQLSVLCATGPFPRLPSAQEELYQPVPGTLARQRWNWVISRIIRHIRRPPLPCFPNPLRRPVPLAPGTIHLPPLYPAILAYSATPPLTSHTLSATLSSAASAHLRALCASANTSVGSGCFALVALVMMVLHERLHPSSQLPLTCGFPVNIRPFLLGPPTTGSEDSLMLGFSALTLPFISSSLAFDARFRLLARQANRQLRTFQKGKRGTLQPGSSSPWSQFFPHMYLGSLERAENKVCPSRRRGIGNPQGAYPASIGGAPATCGVTNVGSTVGLIEPGRYDVSSPLGGRQGLVADFRAMVIGPRVRDGEFFVVTTGDGDRLHFDVTYDANAIDPEKVREWKQLVEGLLEPRPVEAPLSAKL